MNVVMLWFRVAAPVVRDWGWLLGRFLGHRRCAGWLGGSGGCGTSVGEGTARGGRATGGDTLRPLLGCGAGLLPFAQTRFAQTVRSVAAAILTSLTGAPLTSPPAACLPSPEIQSERSQRIVR